MIEGSKISALTNAAALAGSEEFHVVQGGADRAASLAQVRTYVGTIIAGKSGVAASHTGDTTETTLATVTIPGGTIGPNGQVEITCLWSYPNSANAKTMRIKIGGTAFLAVVATTTAQNQHSLRFANRNSQTSQISQSTNMTGSGTTSAAPATYAIDTSADVAVTITGLLASGAETITLESYIVKVFPGS